MKKIILLTLFPSLAFSQQNFPTLEIFDMANRTEIPKKQGKTILQSLKLEDGTLIENYSKIILSDPVSGGKYETVFIGHFSESNLKLGMWAPFPTAYKNQEFSVDSIILINKQGKLTPIVNFSKDNLKGFTFIELSEVNKEVMVK